jgi:hypothetical protein
MIVKLVKILSDEDQYEIESLSIGKEYEVIGIYDVKEVMVVLGQTESQ